MADIDNTESSELESQRSFPKIAEEPTANAPRRKETPIEKADRNDRASFKREMEAAKERADKGRVEAAMEKTYSALVEKPERVIQQSAVAEPVAAPPAPVVEAPVAPVEQAAPAAVVRDPQNIGKQATVEAKAAAPVAPPVAVGMQPAEGDRHILEIIGHRLDEYAAKMAKGVPLKSAQGALEQKKLFSLLDMILRMNGVSFMKAWSIFLQKVHAERAGVFSEAYAYRFYEHTGVEPKALRTYRNLVHLAMHTAEPKSRQRMLRFVDIKTVTADLRIPGAADKLYSYYQL